MSGLLWDLPIMIGVAFVAIRFARRRRDRKGNEGV